MAFIVKIVRTTQYRVQPAKHAESNEELEAYAVTQAMVWAEHNSAPADAVVADGYAIAGMWVEGEEN